MDKNKQDKLKDIVEMYCVSKDMILYCEEIDEQQKSNPQHINELKMGLDHLMRVFAVDLKIKEGDDEYMEENLNSCFNHIYRAGYDALDWVSITLRANIYREIKGFSNEGIATVIPKYYEEIKPEIEDINKKIAELRYEKDAGYKNIEGFMRYAEKVNTLRKYHADILKKKPALVEYDKKLNSEKGWEFTKQFIIITIIGGIIVGITVFLILKFITG